MKNIKFIVLLSAAVFLFGSLGCGGGSSHSHYVNDNSKEEEYESEIDKEVSQIVNQLLEVGNDGSPALFDYSPPFDYMDEDGEDEGIGIKFVKYISSKDLTSGDNHDSFIQTIQLDEGKEYIIKYSHSGRNLNQTDLDLKITAPDGREMILDFIGGSNTVETIDGTNEVSVDKSGLDPIDEENGLTLEEVLAEERELEAEIKAKPVKDPLYVDADFEVIPEENPCIILYSFEAPLSGNYKFEIKEKMFTSGDSLPVSDTPFEFRLYFTGGSYKGSYGSENIELTPRDMLHLQRMLLEIATEFNDNGLPIKFGDEETTASSVNLSDKSNIVRPAFFVLPMDDMYSVQTFIKKKAGNKSDDVVVSPIISNVPYDKDIFESGAGFYAHSGMHAVTGEAINDDNFSENAVEKFNTPNPTNDKELNMKSNLKANLIGTEEEHDSVVELEATSNFALIRNALGLNKMKDYIKLGSLGTKTMHVRYDYIEESPRYFTTDKFELTDDAKALLKRNYNLFQREHGDYFVAGYTWGLRYEATIDITASENTNYRIELSLTGDGSPSGIFRTFDDQGEVCDKAAKFLKELFECAKRFAENGNSSDKARVDELLDLLTRDRDARNSKEGFQNLSISARAGTHTGTATNESQNLRDFVNDLIDYMSKAKNRKKSEYEPLYVTLVRYRELEEAKPYIPEALAVKKGHYDRIRDLTTKIYRTRCYYNALTAIPDDHLQGGASLRAGWEKEFTGLVSEMKLSINRICSDFNSVDSYYKRFDELFEKYKALCERYTFFRYFVNNAKTDQGGSWNEPCGTGAYEVGFWSYTKSDIVFKDFSKNNIPFDHEEPCTSGPGGTRFQVSWSDRRVTGLRTGYVNTNYSKGWDNQHGTLGKKSIDWQYKCASARRLEVYLRYAAIILDDEKYPFAGFDK